MISTLHRNFYWFVIVYHWTKDLIPLEEITDKLLRDDKEIWILNNQMSINLFDLTKYLLAEANLWSSFLFGMIFFKS